MDTCGHGLPGTESCQNDELGFSVEKNIINYCLGGIKLCQKRLICCSVRKMVND
jgi:hypothetical protein